MKRKKIRFPAALFSGILLVFLDQYTKYLAAKFLKPGGPVILIRNVLELRYLEFQGWPETALSLNRSLNGAYKLHRKALDLLQRVLASCGEGK